MMRFISQMFWFVGLILFQVLVLDNTHLFGLFIPIIYIYSLLRWPPDLPTPLAVVLGFVLGLAVDILSNTPGMHAAATTFIAFIRYPILRLFVLKEDLGNKDISIYTIGTNAFWKYAIILVFIHHAILFMLEALSLTNGLMLLKIPICSILTLVFIGALERINRKQDAKS